MLTSEEIKRKELNILIEIDEICRQYNIEYFLAYGTLIGAIRHEGFIPWDDDIDIVMKREDYEKFISVFNEKKNSKFKLLDIDRVDDYYYPFLKVVDTTTKVKELNFKEISDLGVWVDIFPLDNYDEKRLNKKFIESIKSKLLLSRSVKFVKTKSKIKSFIKFIAYIIYRNKNPKKYGIIINNIGKRMNVKTDKYCVLFPPNINKNIYKSDLYNEHIECNFEGKRFFIPKKYHEILTSYYGEYMKLPPIEQRSSGHNIKVDYKF